MTKFELAKILFSRSEKTFITASNGEVVCGYVSAVQKEDGSGSSFNVHITCGVDTRKVHVRTTD